MTPSNQNPVRTLLALTFLATSLSCSSGLGRNEEISASPVGSQSGNLTSGLFFGFDLGAAITDHAAAGGVIPGANLQQDRSVVFYAFVTDAPADDAGQPGAGRRLDRDGLSDANGASDVFIGAVVDRAIDTSAFSFSLAGKFRHPRCTSCHSLAEADTTVFAVTEHPGLPPGAPEFQDIPESENNICMRCHSFALDALDVEGSVLNRAWRNPQRSVDADFRNLTTAELADRARSASDDHFREDRRVAWALSSGVFTLDDGTVTGGADDDQDGVNEPAFDFDGRRRLVPGGRGNFLNEVTAFLQNAPTDTRGALVDVALVSRRVAFGEAGSGASRQPDVTFVPSSDYVAGSAGSAGTLFVAFTSTATDIRPGTQTLTGVEQVYLAEFDVVVGGGGGIQLAYTTTTLVSSDPTTAIDGADQDCGRPSLSADGARVAFATSANNLGTNSFSTSHVYTRDLDTGGLEQVTASNISGGGRAPAIDPSGLFVAYELTDDSASSDSNGFVDVYYSRLNEPIGTGIGFLRRASEPGGAGGDDDNVGDSTQPDVVFSEAGEVLIAFASPNPLDTGTLGAPVAGDSVYLLRDLGGARTVTNVSAALDLVGQVNLADGATTAPAFAGGESALVVETLATNLDSAFLLPPDPQFGATTFKSGDENSGADIVLLDLTGVLDGGGAVRGEALSVSPAGAFGDRASTRPVAGAFRSVSNSSPFGQGFVALFTSATNLGAADNHLGGPTETPLVSMIAGPPAAPEGDFAAAWSVLGPNCFSCHADSNTQGGFSFGNGTRNAAYAALTQLSGTQTGCSGVPLVVPFDSAASLTIQKMVNTAGCGGVMPTSGMLDVALIDIVRDWIDNGALE